MITLLTAGAAVAVADTTTATCPTTRLVTDLVPTSAIGVDNQVNVLLPADYCTSTASYPVLYLLHGAGGNYQDWADATKGDVQAIVGTSPVIVVMPDGGSNGWYSDWVDGTHDYETYDTVDVPNYINTTYRTSGKNAIAGLSMGGYGATEYATRHPSLYQAVASFSGAVDNTLLRAVAVQGSPLTDVVHSQFGTPDSHVWGDPITNSDNWTAHNPTDNAANLSGKLVLLASGDGVPIGKYDSAQSLASNPGSFAEEHFIFQMNVQLTRALTTAGVPFESNFYPGGNHSWPYWRDDLAWALPKLMQVLHG